MILGIITAVVFLFECSIAILQMKKKVNKTIYKIHRYGGYLMLLLSIVHMFMILKVWNNRPIIMNICGCMMCMCILLICLLCGRKKKSLYIHKVLTIILVFLLCVHIYFGLSSFSSYKKAIQEIQITEIDIENVDDGVYEGECNVGYIYAHVRVTIDNNQIRKVELLEHRNERGGAAQVIPGEIVKKQSVCVDAVSSATNSSKVIEKAVENALTGEK